MTDYLGMLLGGPERLACLSLHSLIAYRAYRAYRAYLITDRLKEEGSQGRDG